ncbi:restriction endonuclease subunit S, partial [Mycoplasmopsis verecunda]
MSKLERLIKKICPDGVEYVKLDNLLDYEQPTKYIIHNLKKNLLSKGKTPVIIAGKTFIVGYTNETNDIYRASLSPIILFEDFMCNFQWVDFDFKLKSSTQKMLTVKNENKCNLKYVYYYMNIMNYQPKSHQRHWISKYSQLKIPLPPLEIQNEIVRILDTFTELEKELEKELE